MHFNLIDVISLTLFCYEIYSIYSQTKGEVDGSAQARAILRSSTSSFRWERHIVSQTLKTLPVKAFVGWRMIQRTQMLHNKDNFQILDKYRTCLKSVQSLAD
jgi:hypothetical protein